MTGGSNKLPNSSQFRKGRKLESGARRMIDNAGERSGEDLCGESALWVEDALYGESAV
ncbi:MAG: hypothetical protein M3014_03975 [Chloroflexota bacterium]|nr:hypothetical protein [Chloroflexota bacterium]